MEELRDLQLNLITVYKNNKCYMIEVSDYKTDKIVNLAFDQELLKEFIVLLKDYFNV